MSDTTTSAGTIIGVSVAAPATFDAAGYAALTFTPIGGVESIPAFGADIAVNSFQPLSGDIDKNKGPVNHGSLTLPMAFDDDDAGQTILQTLAAPGNNAPGYFCISYTSGAKRYLTARVFGMPETPGAASNVIMANPKLEVIKPVIKVAAA